MTTHRPLSLLSTPAAQRMLVLALLLALTMPLRAQVSKLTASDASIGDEFGEAVAFDGTTAIVGARMSDPAGSESGAAYVFVQREGGWTEQARLIASDGETRDRFGRSVAISGAYAAVGATSDDDGGDSAGAVYVFVREGETWTEQAKLIASDAADDDSFGRAVALDGDYLLVSAPGNDERGNNTGAAYVFKREGETWTEQAKLTAADAIQGDSFGSAVALEGDRAVIGAAGDSEPSGASGSAYVFEREGEAWIERDKFFARDGTTDDFFGETVALSGDYILVGMRMDDDDGEGSGSAYVYVRTGERWLEQAKLVASDAAAGDAFGTGVALSGALAVIGAPGNDDAGDGAGSVYVFQRAGTAWTEQVALTPSDALPGAAFGNSVALNGVSALIAAFKDDDRATRAGSAYLYTLSAPVAPRLAEPADAATDVSPDVTLRWEAVGGAATYRVQVSTSMFFSTLVAEAAGLTQTAFQPVPLGLGTTYYWRVSASNSLGVGPWSDVRRFTVASATGIELVEDEVPDAYRLGPNYPNPFTPTTTIPFAVPVAAHVVLVVFDATGAAVETVVDEFLAAGRYTTTWEGGGLASGIYFVRMRAGTVVQTETMILLK